MRKQPIFFFILVTILILIFTGCYAMAELFHGPEPEQEFTVTFNANGAGGAAPGALAVVSGTVISLPGKGGLASPGNIFAGWNESSGGAGVTYTAGSSVTVARDMVFYAQWLDGSTPQYTVTYNANGASDGAAPAPQTAYNGTNVIIAGQGTLVYAGKIFGGWNTQADGGGTNYETGALYTVTGNVTLYAKWNSAVQYTVTFNANGASGTAPAAQTVDPGTGITLPGTGSMAYSGRSFGGWNTSTGGTGTNYAEGDSYTVTGNVTLYAKWDASATTAYTVTFNTNGASGTAPAAMSANQNASITLPGQGSLTRTGYTFGGWNTQADGGGTNYESGASYTVTANVTLYAKWNSAVQYTVTFNANGASGTAPAAQTVKSGTQITIPDAGTLTYSGRTFGGWNTQPGGDGTNYNAGATYTVNGNITLYAKWIINSSIIEMVWINPGTYTRGSPATESNRNSNETQHQVTLTKSFYMGKYVVTQEQYQAVTGVNPSGFSSSPASGEVQGRRPVEQVTWFDAVEFCNKLSEQEGLTPAYSITGRSPTSGYPITSATVTVNWNANGYRLPTEAEWEYACRAGTTTAYNTGDTISNDTGWYSSNSGSKTHEVGLKPPNAWGLYDMHGNVWERCWDWYVSYSSGTHTDPVGAASGSSRVDRGSGYAHTSADVRSARRSSTSPSYRDNSGGFRIVRF
ncbi:MAG: InlB B-repeat-containing protein [Treponema sp.]|jgi:uncharacterized repeat protein (TIGR02543 family)|nr:InlB B-repeat-containing protein [Treponema sp.]